MYSIIFSWWWAVSCPKHVETYYKWNIYLIAASSWCSYLLCRVLFQNKINLGHCASGWFYYINKQIKSKSVANPPRSAQLRRSYRFALLLDMSCLLQVLLATLPRTHTRRCLKLRDSPQLPPGDSQAYPPTRQRLKPHFKRPACSNGTFTVSGTEELVNIVTVITITMYSSNYTDFGNTRRQLSHKKKLYLGYFKSAP